MAVKKRRIVKTLYAEDGGKALRLQFTEEVVARLRKLQATVQNLPLERGEYALIEYYMRKSIVLVRKKSIDIGNWGYEGWETYLGGSDSLKTIDDLPEVHFTSMFLYYMQGGYTGVDDAGREGFTKLILPKHKELIVWKKIEGTA